MRNWFIGSLAIGLLSAATFAACIGPTDSGDDEETTGDGGSGATGNAGGSSNDGGGGAGAGNASCTEIAGIANFHTIYDLTWEGGIEPSVTGPAPDFFELDVPMTGTSFTLPANYDDCASTAICALVYEDFSEEAGSAAYYMANAGSITVDELEAPYHVTGSMSDVTLIQVTVDEDTFDVAPVAGGRCLHVASFEFAVISPPNEWLCSPGYHDEAGHGDDTPDCDCACGAADPDCENAANPVLGCEMGQTCGAVTGVCEGVPDAWTCPDDQYNGGAGNGCDCNCGTYDPDCDIMTEAVQNCPADSVCTTGTCVPSAWDCSASFYDSGLTDDCDCGCGALDPDCENGLIASCDYCDDIGSCSEDELGCPGVINPTNNIGCSN